MASSVKVETDLPPLLKKLNKVYRQEILQGLADSVDDIRRIANERYIIPDRNPGVSVRRKYQLQPTDPKKLTSRTGALKKMLMLGVGDWKKGASTYRSNSPAVQANIRTLNPSSTLENYEATISYNIKDASAISSKRTAKQLAGRFLWDTPNGVRGTRRPHLSAAAQDDVGLKGVEEKVKRKLQALGVL